MANYEHSLRLSADLIINFDFGNTVGSVCLCPYSDNFLVLKENGCLQIWNNREKCLINRVSLNENVNLTLK